MIVRFAVLAGLWATAAVADVDVLTASLDTTLYAKDDKLSNGAGEYLFAGRTDGGDLLRALIAFDVAAAVPPGSTITEVTLDLYMSRTRGGAETVSLHRVSADWGEGISDADGEEGGGANAESGDATWRYRFYDPDTPESSPAWASLGGDYQSAPSASAVIGNNGFYTWGSNSGMVADVQSWLDSPAANFGWIMIGNEATNQTAKRFNSRQNSNTNRRPQLIVTYTTPSGACCFDDGTCAVLPSDTCNSQVGQYAGNGTTCSPNTCPQPGACCLPDGTCAEYLTDACATAGGAFQGEGTACATTDCDGACCFTNGSCTVATLGDCGNQGGTYQSFGSTCSPNPCTQPDGACCLDNGSCRFSRPRDALGKTAPTLVTARIVYRTRVHSRAPAARRMELARLPRVRNARHPGAVIRVTTRRASPIPARSREPAVSTTGPAPRILARIASPAAGSSRAEARPARRTHARNRQPVALTTEHARSCWNRPAPGWAACLKDRKPRAHQDFARFN